jgi:N utilization substance protein B
MLSRRNIRIKVMQVLYSMSRDEKITYPDALRRYRNIIQKSFELYLFNLWTITHVAAYAKEDEQRKNQKLLPSEEDKLFTAKLYENPLTQSMVNHPTLKNLFQQLEPKKKIDEDSIRRLYIEHAKTEEYKKYVHLIQETPKDHTQALLNLYKSCINNEIFTDLLEDNYPSWIDDKSLIVGSIKKTIKALPAELNFLDSYLPSEEATVEFGETLLKNVCSGDQQLLEMIEPTLKNWDAERVAVIDMILLKMALSELLSFPTIPTKVTLNEFVEISKLYSTDKSKDFINGILDRLLKKLTKEGKIKKEGRGLVD